MSPVPTDTEIAAACAVVDTKNPSDNNNVLAGSQLDKTSLKQGPGTYTDHINNSQYSVVTVIVNNLLVGGKYLPSQS